MAQHGVRGTISGMASRANPAFAVAVVVVPLGALGYAVTVASLRHHIYVHVMAGVLWTGIDVFMGIVLGPVLGGLDEAETAAVFRRLTPKLAFLLPSLAIVTIAAGLVLATRQGRFGTPAPWFALFTAATLPPALFLIGYRLDGWRDWRWQLPFAAATIGSVGWVALTIPDLQMVDPAIGLALVIVTILSVQGFGFLLPGEVRIYQEMASPQPRADVIARIGQQNAALGGLQGLFQFVLVLDMVYLSQGGVPF